MKARLRHGTGDGYRKKPEKRYELLEYDMVVDVVYVHVGLLAYQDSKGADSNKASLSDTLKYSSYFESVTTESANRRAAAEVVTWGDDVSSFVNFKSCKK